MGVGDDMVNVEDLDRVVRKIADEVAANVGVVSIADVLSESLSPLYPTAVAVLNAVATDPTMTPELAEQQLAEAQRKLSPNAQAFTIDSMRPSNPYGTPPPPPPHPAPGQGAR